MKKYLVAVLVTALFSLFSLVAVAQDTRHVVEPVIPPLCATLGAHFSGAGVSTKEDDTLRLQEAIDHCPNGHAVQLSSDAQHSAYTSGPLHLRGGVTLLIDKGVILYASTDPRAYDKDDDNGNHRCGTNDASGKGCKSFILVDDSHGDGIMGDGVIDGQGGQRMAGKNESWWQLSRRAQKENAAQNVPHLIEINRATDFSLYRITLRNSMKYHVILHQVDGFTAWGVKLDTPAAARNTDGIDPISSRNVTVSESFIRAGDDNISIKSGNGIPSENISIVHNHFYSGHGMSIGSNTDGGIRHILVDDLSMDGTVSGLRIKSDISRGGLVSDVHFQHICLRNIRNPFDVDTAYTRGASGNKIPDYQDIFFEHIRGVGGGKLIFQGIDAQHPIVITMTDIALLDIGDISARHVHFNLGAGVVLPSLAGDDVKIDKTGGGTDHSEQLVCDGKLIDFPE